MSDQDRETSLDENLAGAELGASVVDAEGQVLVPGGTLLTLPIIELLRARGIESLVISQPPLEPAAKEREMLARINYLFRNCGNNLPACDLQRQLIAYRLKEKS